MEDYKEKLRLAKEALDSGSYDKETIEYIFPELKESEDIWKEIIECLKNNALGYPDKTRNKWISWLEKQGEKIDVIENFDTEFEKQVSHLIASTINKEYEYTSDFIKWTANALLNYAKHELEKQGEHKCDCKYVGCHVNNVKRWCHKKQSEILYEKCNIKCSEYLKQGERKQNVTDIISDLENYFATTTKEQQEKDWEEIKKWEEKHFNHDRHIEITPTNKVEPKFKVGDWIINSKGTLRHILAVDRTGYETNEGWLTHDIYENEFHLWTIQDAKDGNVLVYKGEIFLLKSYTLWHKIVYHCCYDGKGLYSHSIYEFLKKEDFENIHLATKEQRELLFQKMKEAGYEWDSEKKELKKIEQKPAWSEEDEKMFRSSRCYLNEYGNLLSSKNEEKSITIYKACDWLRDLKDRQL